MKAVALVQRAKLTTTRPQSLFLLLQRTATFATKSSSSGLTITTDGEVCPIRSFALTNPKLAKQILKVPSINTVPLADTNGSNGNPILQRRRGKAVSTTTSLEAYLDWRNWDIKSTLQRNKFDYDDNKAYQLAVGLLSHTLTFPLTLGHYFGRNTDVGNSINDESFCRKKQRVMKTDDVLRLCCVGARAECTLPNDYWKEFLLVFASTHTGSAGTIESTQQQNSIHECIIDFIGPDVPHHLVSRTIDISSSESSNTCNSNDDDDDDANNLNYRLTMNYHSSYLHEYLLQHRKTILGVTFDDNGSSDNHSPPWDGYVLFNPGLGHTNLKSQWYKTLMFILRTGKPILLTAHSRNDAERDRTLLETMIVEDVNGQYFVRNVLPFTTYVENPFASQMRYMDPFSSTNIATITTTAMATTTTTKMIDTNGIHHDIVQPNQYALFLP